MSKTSGAWDPHQTYLLPPSPRDWLPDGDLVYFMLDVAQTLDLSAITRKQTGEHAWGMAPDLPDAQFVEAVS